MSAAILLQCLLQTCGKCLQEANIFSKGRPCVRRKSDLPLYIGQIHAFNFDTTPFTLNDNVNAKSV